jgi:L-Ala-D/L-Glu epimerase
VWDGDCTGHSDQKLASNTIGVDFSVTKLTHKNFTLSVAIEIWSNAAPFHISGHTFSEVELIVVELCDGRHTGRGEATGVFFMNETAPSMVLEVEAVRKNIELGATRQELRSLLGPGGARNALDCAMWELESKQASKTVSSMAGICSVNSLLTTFTVAIDSPSCMANRAQEFSQAKAIKLKLKGDALDRDRVIAVRAARPDVWLAVDANQAFSLEDLQSLMPTLVASDVKLIEQPFRIGEEAVGDGVAFPIPFAADESVRTLEDIPKLVGRFATINIKLDKCGGLTEGLLMAEKARLLGFGVMVGSMPCTSLALAPSIILGQLCDLVDLDAPLFLKKDRDKSARYENGHVFAPEGLWGWSAP